MDVDKEQNLQIIISKQEENNRASFLQLLKQGSKFYTPSKIYQSKKKISQSKNKTRRVLIFIKPIENSHETIEAEVSLL